MCVLHGWPLHIFVFNMLMSIAMSNPTKKGFQLWVLHYQLTRAIII